MNNTSTTVINLYGGAGAGKSTLAALLFATLKMDGRNVELVREYVKSWAWAGKIVSPADQLYLLGKQSSYESLLYGKVDIIVTDSPVLLAGAYAERSNGPEVAGYVTQAARHFNSMASREYGVRHVDFFVNRGDRKYNPKGRYQSESEARDFDEYLLKFLKDSWVDPIHLEGSFEQMIDVIIMETVGGLSTPLDSRPLVHGRIVICHRPKCHQPPSSPGSP